VHSPFQLQKFATSSGGQSGRLQGSQGAPHVRFEHGVIPAQPPDQATVHTPWKHSAVGQEVSPLAHVVHAIGGTGQSVFS
jgi:hypothetical protein